ncbi:hypothetical protein PSECIP111951_01157 [Pseudoalteromonas holothuriae]|uniref:Tail fiber protein n=1 Tax=Pseudoalteromonas holothuriae TaxID=2963714 RepID=A0ABM9GFV2_9GAMM|nr:hypothetical protein [Pseudoalteromonas sp. CIP111951]CAH9055025.1 hypothetical protein PSECIP111951_01157 [Pseudoalteromonas sp. CIP111951]
MSIDLELAKITKIVSEQTDASNNLKTAIEDSWQEVEKVHDLAKHNHQVVHDWQTKTGQVTLKDLDNKDYQVDTLATLINETQKINPHPEVMSKAQFDALRQMRKQQYAGSGFVEWGKHNRGARYLKVNEGMWHWIHPNLENGLIMGEVPTNAIAGVSKSIYPKVLVDGILQHVYGVAHSSTQTVFKFPPAPDGTKTYDSATGKVTQHASAAEAFEGVVTNGGFRSGDISGWSLNAASDEVTVSNGVATLTDVDSTYASLISQHVATEVGKEYVLKVSIKVHEDKQIFAAFGDTEFIERTSNVGQWYDVTLKCIATASSTRINVGTNSPTSVGESVSIRNVSVMPITEHVITSRKDLVFLESWHEKIADKDVVYPLGNVQFGTSTYEGVSLANNLVAQGYSAFGEWDSDTKGYGVKWSTLSAVNRVKFFKNPEHNIYYDPEAKAYIQVRYRVRVVEGFGDDWRACDGANQSYNLFLAGGTSGNHVVARGSYADVFSDYNNVSVITSSYRNSDPTYGLNSVGGGETYWNDRGITIGKCFAIPIALVQRLNQGAYHPVYNPMGTGKRRINGGFYYNWYEKNSALTPVNSAFDCFDKLANNAGGNIGQEYGWARISHGASYVGRPDQYKYHDAIYAGQVEDLRLNANKLDVNQLREDTMRKAVAGTLRGKGRVPFSLFEHEHAVTLVEPAYYNAANAGGSIQFVVEGGGPALDGYLSDHQNVGFYLYNQNGTSLYVPRLKTSSVDYVNWPYSGDSQPTCYVYNVENKVAKFNELFSVGDILHVGVLRELTGEFDSLPWVDIIGHPERIAATFPDGVIGQWVPELPIDGATLISLNRKYVSNFSSLVTVDNGSSWSTGGAGNAFNQITNTWFYNAQKDEVRLISYETPADISAPNTSSKVCSHVSHVWGGNDSRINLGSRLQHSLTLKVPTVNAYTTNTYTPVIQSNLLNGQFIQDEFPKHSALPVLGQKQGSYGVKALPTITEKNGLLYMQFHGAQMVYTAPNVSNMTVITAGQASSVEKGKTYILKGFDNASVNRAMVALATSSNFTWTATAFDGYTVLDTGEIITNTGVVYNLLRLYTGGWGDDQTIPIVNGEDVKTDLNGNTVKVFCHHTQLPLGIASH